MVDIPMRSSAPVTRQTVLSINERKVEGAKTTRTITSINHTQSQTASKASSGTTSSMQHTAMHPSAMHNTNHHFDQPHVISGSIKRIHTGVKTFTSTGTYGAKRSENTAGEFREAHFHKGMSWMECQKSCL